MTATDTDDDETEKSIDSRWFHTARAEWDDLREQADTLFDALEAGDADEDDVDSLLSRYATAYVPVEDTADVAGVIDSTAPKYRAINQARSAIFRLAHGDTKAALDALAKATAYTEAHRDGLDAEAAHKRVEADPDDASMYETTTGNYGGDPQLWFPPNAAEELGLEIGDSATVRVEEGRAIVTRDADETEGGSDD